MTPDPTLPMPKPPKRPYSTPKLVTYGDVTTLTQAQATGQKADTGGKQKNRTNN